MYNQAKVFLLLPSPIVNDEPMTEEELLVLVAELEQLETQKDTDNETKISGDAEKISLAQLIEEELARYGEYQIIKEKDTKI